GRGAPRLEAADLRRRSEGGEPARAGRRGGPGGHGRAARQDRRHRRRAGEGLHPRDELAPRGFLPDHPGGDGQGSGDRLVQQPARPQGDDHRRGRRAAGQAAHRGQPGGGDHPGDRGRAAPPQAGGRRPGDGQALRHRRDRRPLGGAAGGAAGAAHPRHTSDPDSSTGSAMTSTSAPLRQTVIGSGRPMASANISRCRLPASATGLRPALSTRSPARSPARSAGEPAITSTTRSAASRPVRRRSGGGSGAGEVTSPRNARRTRPSRISAATMSRVVPLTGTASPTPAPATAVLTPTTRAWESASAPPELPGLSAASVWITSSMSRTDEPLRAGSDRPSPETTPAVTDPASPSGLPTATTS